MRCGHRAAPRIIQPYVVHFLLHDTLGAWWARKVPTKRPELTACAPDEGALRDTRVLPGYRFDMLRFVLEG